MMVEVTLCGKMGVVQVLQTYTIEGRIVRCLYLG
jgi:hypothetical protein